MSYVGSQAALADSEVRVIAKGRGYLFASWRQAYVLDWRDTTTKESLDAAVLGKRSVYADNPAGIVVFNLLASESPLPSSEIREYAERKQSEDTEGVLCHATVVDGRGFWASTMRSMLAGLYLVSRSPFPRKVFSNVDEAAAWQSIMAKAGRAWAQGLGDAVRAIRGMR